MSNCQSIFTFLKYFILELFKNKKMLIWPNLEVLNLINKDNIALKYQRNKDKFPCSVKIVKVTYTW